MITTCSTMSEWYLKRHWRFMFAVLRIFTSQSSPSPAVEHQSVFYLHIDTIAYYYNWLSFLSAFVPTSLGIICLNAFGASCTLWSLSGILGIEYTYRVARTKQWTRLLYAGGSSSCGPFLCTFLFLPCFITLPVLCTLFDAHAFRCGNQGGLGLETCLALNAYVG
jgi:hypothetical protein